MKIIKNLVVLLLFLGSPVVYGMKRAYPQYDTVLKEKYDAKIQTYFAPADRKAMKDDLFSLLDNATNAIYVAMYLITDDSLFDKLIAAKKRGVTVEIYIDESSADILKSIEKLLNNDIVPIVFPSKLIGTGIMHDKFFIVDFKTVVTGSANFTRPAFDANTQVFNYENTVVIHSDEIASEYLKTFVGIQVGIFNAYIDMIANYDSKFLPAWFSKLWPILFKKESRLPQAYYRRMNTYSPDDIKWQRASEFVKKTIQW